MIVLVAAALLAGTVPGTAAAKAPAADLDNQIALLIAAGAATSAARLDATKPPRTAPMNISEALARRIDRIDRK